jgi:hypothetical protein
VWREEIEASRCPKQALADPGQKAQPLLVG